MTHAADTSSHRRNSPRRQFSGAASSPGANGRRTRRYRVTVEPRELQFPAYPCSTFYSVGSRRQAGERSCKRLPSPVLNLLGSFRVNLPSRRSNRPAALSGLGGATGRPCGTMSTQPSSLSWKVLYTAGALIEADALRVRTVRPLFRAQMRDLGVDGYGHRLDPVRRQRLHRPPDRAGSQAQESSPDSGRTTGGANRSPGGATRSPAAKLRYR